MLTQDYLSLRLIRLKGPEHWAHEGAELAFIFPKGGSGALVPAKIQSKLIPGDVLVLNGASQDRISVADAAELVFWFFSANVEHLFPLFGCSEVSLLKSVTETFKSPRLYPAASPLALECHKLLGDVPPRFDLDHRGQLLRVVAGILSAEFKNVRPQRDGFVGMEEHMTQVFEKMSVSEILSLSVGDLAARFGCSRRHLSRLFHQHFGLSVAALRMEMRLLKAVSLLRDPTAKIINIAEQCGFNHLGLFNTCFKRRFGVSPGQWRKRPGEDQSQPNPIMPGEPVCRMKAIGLCNWTGTPLPGGISPRPAEPERAEHPAPSPSRSGAGPSRGKSSANEPKRSRATVSRLKLRNRLDP